MGTPNWMHDMEENYVGKLYEHFNGRTSHLVYEYVNEGTDHEPVFTAMISSTLYRSYGKNIIGIGMPELNKKQAKQSAAKAFFDELKNYYIRNSFFEEIVRRSDRLEALETSKGLE